MTDSSLKHLTLCLTLEEIYLEGNVCVVDYSELKKLLQRKMKKLKILDGKGVFKGDSMYRKQRV